jgi:putative intracellular protease/amidase
VDTSNWSDWHDEYDDPESELAGRMRSVRDRVAEVVAASPPGPVTIVSMCGGQGRELIGALEGHPRRSDVRGRLIELDTDNAEVARRSARDAHLDDLEVVTGDASASDAYAGLARADLVVISGLFGHLDDADQVRTISFLRQICAEGAAVVWTSFRPDAERAHKLRRFFVEQSFEELAYDRLPGDEYAFTVALSRLTAPVDPFQPHRKLFTFGSSRQHRDV